MKPDTDNRWGMRAWALAAVFAGWAGFVIFHYFAQFADYLRVAWGKLPW